MRLSPQQETFASVYVATLNVTAAAERAGYSAPERTGTRLLANVGVRQRVQLLMEAASVEAGVPSAAEVIRRVNAIAWADVRELQQVRISCCRHCHGEGFAYQWRSEQEWGEAVERALHEHESRMKSWNRRTGGDGEVEPAPKLELPSDQGGFSFDAHLLPIDECPKCDGDGIREILLADTRFLSPGGRLLYGGVKQTKDGLQIVVKDQMKAIELVMRHRGLLNDKLTVITPGGAGALGVEQRHLEKLSPESLDGFMKAHEELMALQKAEEEERRALAAPPPSTRPLVVGEITDVPA